MPGTELQGSGTRQLRRSGLLYYLYVVAINTGFFHTGPVFAKCGASSATHSAWHQDAYDLLYLNETPMKTTTHILAAALAIAAASCNKVKEPDWNSTDEKFIQMAAYGNHNEIEAGVLDTSKATDQSVKDYGRMMIMDHMNAQDELKRIAKDKKQDIPSEADATHKTMMQQMAAMSGRSFDSMYIHSQVKDHKDVISLFREELDKGKDEDLKDYANKYLPAIQMHLHHADTISNRF